MRRTRLSRALPLAVFAWLSGCEAIIDGRLTTVNCDAEGTIGPPACPDGFLCKQATCVASDLGYPCSDDGSCGPTAFCLDPAPFGFSGARSCSRACCTSTDCGASGGLVCAVPTTGGGNLCVPAGALGRPFPGSVGAWGACIDHSDCRSARCEDGHCADTCCNDTSCAGGGGVCAFRAEALGDPVGDGFRCGPPLASVAVRYAPCASDRDCASGLCLDLGGSLRCSSPCCSSAECEVLETAARPVACASVARNGQMIRACSKVLSRGAVKEVGTSCVQDGDCRSGTCVMARCSDACCSDESCGDPYSFRCLPAVVSPSQVLQCALN